MQQKFRQVKSVEPATASTNRSLWKIVCSLSAIAVCAKIFGFTEKLIIARFFGTSDIADVYFASMGIVLSIVFLVKELVYPSLTPVFASCMSESKLESGILFRKTFFLTAILLGMIVAFIMAFPDFITRILVPGFSLAKQQATSNLLIMLLPAMCFLGLSMVTNATLNAKKCFLKAVLPETAQKLFIVICLIPLLPILGIKAFAIVLGTAALGALLTHMYFLPERAFLLNRNHGTSQNDNFHKLLCLMGPLVLGAVFSHISGIVDNILASKLPSGHLSYLGYSKKLIDAILLIGPVALVTVFFSHASHLVSLNDHEILRKMLRKITRLLLYVSVPFACLLIALNEPIISFLFQRGEFSIESTLGTSQAFMIYAVGLVTFSFEPLLVHSFFALSDTKTPVKFGVICVIFDIILAIALLKPFGYMGIAGAFVLSKTIKILILGTILNKRLPGIFDYKQISFLFRLSVATLLMWIVLKFTTDIDNNNTPLNTLIFDLAIPSISAILTFVLASVLLRIQEFRELLLIFKGRKK